MIQQTNKRNRKRKKKKTIVAKTSKLKQMTMKKTKNEIAKDFFVLIFISGFLFSFLPNLRRKHFGGFGEKTPKPYQFSTHKYSQPNMLRKFFSSLVFSLFFFFFILPKIRGGFRIFVWGLIGLNQRTSPPIFVGGKSCS